ncbi:MAG: murein biosynthesis integral membrane protein MurJ, partial [Planctomycetota bacterium]
KEGQEAQNRLAEKFLTLWVVLVTIVTLVGVIFASPFVLFAFQWGSFAQVPGKTELTAQLTQLIFWYLLLVGMGAAVQGILNSRKYFGVPSAGPALFNVAFISVAWIVAPQVDEDRQVFVLASGILAGGFVQLASMLPLVWKIGIRPRLRWPFDHAGVKRILKLFVPAVFGAGIYQINVLLSTLLAGRLAYDGAVTVLNASSRLAEIVLGVFVFAVGTVSLTTLSERASQGDNRGFAEEFLWTLRLVLFITIPSCVGLYLLREPILSLLLQSGRFDEEALRQTAWVFQFHVPGLIFVGASRILVNAFYAYKDVETPVRIAFVNLFINLGLAAALSEGDLVYAGIALASTLAAAIQVVMLASALSSKVTELSFRTVAAPALQSVGAAAVMGVAVWGGRFFIPEDAGKVLLGVAVFGVIGVGGAVFFGVASILRMREAAFLLRGVKRKLGR